MNRVPQDFIDAMKRISGGQPDMATNTQAAQKGTGNLYACKNEHAHASSQRCFITL